MRRSRGAGVSLVNTLIVVSVLALLAFTVAAFGVYHLTFTSRLSNGEVAQNLAESTAHLAISQLLQVPAWGVSRDVAQDILITRPYGVGRLTFNPAQAARWGQEYSSNNLEGSNSLAGVDPARPVPKAAAQLVASARVGGVTRRVEVVLYVPPFPYAIAASGAFRSAGGLQVGAVSSAASLADLSSLDPSQLVAADLASNAPTSLVLGPNTHVTGDVRSAGAIELDPTTVVGGQVKSHVDPVRIPKEEVRSYDPLALGKPNVQSLLPGLLEKPVYQGFVRSPGDLSITGGLTLNNGVLYVDGDLEVAGGIQGSGAVFVTGRTRLTGASNVTTDNTVALMSQGDVSITGAGQASSFFQGLLYTEGNFTASQVSLLGVFIQNGAAGSAVNITDSRLISVGDYAHLEVPVDLPGKPPTAASANLFFNTDGTTWNGVYGSNGPVVFEAYPVLSGGFDLVDPNTNAILHYATLDDMAHGVKKIMEDNDHKGRQMLALKDASGALTRLRVYNPGGGDVQRALGPQLAAIAPRPVNTSYVIRGTPGGTDHLKVDPSRFLALKDRSRILYWRAR